MLILITAYFGYRLFRNPVRQEDGEIQQARELTNWQAAAYLTFGLALLILSAEALVYAASSVARRSKSPLLLLGLP